MRSYTMFFLLLFLSIFFFCETARSTYQRRYRIDVHPDGSSIWIIEHRFIKGEDETTFRQLSDYTYFSGTFVKNIKSLVNATREQTQRTNMSVETFVMTTSVVDSYSVVKYQFCWREFAETENTNIEIGDVFEVEGLFLYGEGTVDITYPLNYIVESVSPSPHATAGQTLTWYGIKDLEKGETKIVLKQKVASGFIEIVKENILVIVVSLIVLFGVGSTGFYFLKSRKKEMEEITGTKAPLPPSFLEIEDDEEKVVNLLRAARGSLYQSTIADQCGFSRSKTSKLLTTMENEGKITRKKKGREKVVTLTDKS